MSTALSADLPHFQSNGYIGALTASYLTGLTKLFEGCVAQFRSALDPLP